MAGLEPRPSAWKATAQFIKLAKQLLAGFPIFDASALKYNSSGTGTTEGFRGKSQERICNVGICSDNFRLFRLFSGIVFLTKNKKRIRLILDLMLQFQKKS